MTQAGTSSSAAGGYRLVGIDAPDQLYDSLAEIVSQPLLDVVPRRRGHYACVYEIQTAAGSHYYKSFVEVPGRTLRATSALEAHRLALGCNDRSEDRAFLPVLNSVHNGLLFPRFETFMILQRWLENGSISNRSMFEVSIFLARFHWGTRRNQTEHLAGGSQLAREHRRQMYRNCLAPRLSREALIAFDRGHEVSESNPSCLVHGNLTARHVLLGQECVELMDFEYIHWGDPASDLGGICAEFFISLATFDPDSLESKLDIFLVSYLSVYRDLQSVEFEQRIAYHLASRILYRFYGPSARRWTHYVPTPVRDSLLTLARDILLQQLPITSCASAFNSL